MGPIYLSPPPGVTVGHPSEYLFSLPWWDGGTGNPVVIVQYALLYIEKPARKKARKNHTEEEEDGNEHEDKVDSDSFWDGFEKHMTNLKATLDGLNEAERIKCVPLFNDIDLLTNPL